MIRPLVSVLIFALIAGCTVLPQRDPQRTFLLETPNVQPTNRAGFDLTLLLALPQTQTPHGSSQILVNSNGYEMQAYAGARWSKPVPQLLQAQLIKGLRESRLMRAVIGESNTGRTDLTLTSDLNEFELDFRDSSARVALSLNVQLIDSQSRQILKATEIRVTRQVQDKPVESVVEGFGAATHQLNVALIAWLETTIRTLYAGKDPARLP